MGYERFAAALADAGVDGGDRARPPARRARRRGRTPPTPPASRPCCSPRRPRPTTACAPSASGRAASSTASRCMGVTGERDVAGDAGRGDGPAAARRSPTSRCCSASGISNAEQAVEAAQLGRRRGRRQRARARACSRAVGPTARTTFVARAARRARRRDRDRTGVIKYLGSKRRLVPVLAALCEAARARTALDLFTGTTRVAQAFKQTRRARSPRSTPRGTPRCSPVATSRPTPPRVDKDDARRRARAPRRRSRASPATSPRRSASSRGSSSR